MTKYNKLLALLFFLLFAIHVLLGCGMLSTGSELEPTLEKFAQDVLNDYLFENGSTEEQEQITKAEGLTDGQDEITLPAENLKVHFLAVGQADSILVQSGEHFMLIDAGNNNDAGFVVNYLKKLGVNKLDYVVGTHPHEDHIGGLDAIIDTFDVGKVLMPKVTTTTKTFEDVLKAIKKKGLKITAPVPGSTWEIGSAKVEVLAPNSKSYDSLNNYSIVLKVTYGENVFLFTGDAEAVSEGEMLEKNYELAADVLKVGHHGSSTSTTDAFLKKVSPDYAVISVGKDNKYGHPHQETLAKLVKKDVKVYRTDEQGTIVFSSDGQLLSVETISGDK